MLFIAVRKFRGIRLRTASRLPKLRRPGHVSSGCRRTIESDPTVLPRELPPFIRDFISRHVRSVEQLEILLLFSRDVFAVWSAKKVYDAILSSPHSVERWLGELSHAGLLERLPDSGDYKCCTDDVLISQIAALAEFYRTSPVRVVEAIYKRGPHAAQSFADAFRIKKNDEPTS